MAGTWRLGFNPFPCYVLSVSLVCSATSMTVTLTTDDAFTGKLFSYNKPRKCSVKGTGGLETSLTFEYEDPTDQCGANREDEGIFR